MAIQNADNRDSTQLHRLEWLEDCDTLAALAQADAILREHTTERRDARQEASGAGRARILTRATRRRRARVRVRRILTALLALMMILVLLAGMMLWSLNTLS